MRRIRARSFSPYCVTVSLFSGEIRGRVARAAPARRQVWTFGGVLLNLPSSITSERQASKLDNFGEVVTLVTCHIRSQMDKINILWLANCTIFVKVVLKAFLCTPRGTELRSSYVVQRPKKKVKKCCRPDATTGGTNSERSGIREDKPCGQPCEARLALQPDLSIISLRVGGWSAPCI